ncbi:MAG: hypothetical protein AAGD10_02765 [Myxococcota bacterium]
MSRVLAGLGLLLSIGCSGEPAELVQRALSEASKPEGLPRFLHPDYRDPLGGTERLLAELETRPPTELRIEEARTRWGPSKRRPMVEIEAVVEWPRWRVVGRETMGLERGAWGHSIRSGFLTGARDVQSMVDELLAARTPSEAIELVHPNYAQGLESRADLAEEWAQGPHPSGADWSEVDRVELVQGRLELRPDRSHLDLHLRLPAVGGPRPVTLRLTLAPAAGRWRIVAGF